MGPFVGGTGVTIFATKASYPPALADWMGLAVGKSVELVERCLVAVDGETKPFSVITVFAVAQKIPESPVRLQQPLRMRRAEYPAGLTGREVDVLRLVARGLSSRQIADRLVMSVRTVEGHVYRACQRVGATSRADLAAILRAGPGELEKSDV